MISIQIYIGKTHVTTIRYSSVPCKGDLITINDRTTKYMDEYYEVEKVIHPANIVEFGHDIIMIVTKSDFSFF